MMQRIAPAQGGPMKRPEMNKSNHPIEQEELMAYLDGELSTDRAAAAVAHLEQCQECQRLAADLRAVSRKLMDWEVGSSRPRVTRVIAAALEGKGPQPGVAPSVTTRARLGWLVPWLIGVVAAVGLGVILVSSIGQRSNTVFSRVANSIDGGVPYDEYKGGSVGKLQAQQEASGVGGGANANAPVPQGLMIVRSATIALTTRDFDKARIDLEEILKRHHGYIGDLKVTAPTGDGRTLSALLRVPSDELEATMAELRNLARVSSESQSGEEVTAQYVDLEARLSNARNTEQRLRDLLRQRTGKLADVLAVETEISRVRGEIERMEAERKNLANRVAFASLNATITEDYKAQLQVVPSSISSRFRNAAVEGYRTMVEGLVDVVVFLVSYGPTLLLWAGLLFFPVRGVWRKWRRSPVQSR
jgi:Domain of unknown function (DUF4349)/Putative zinc-finger